MPHADCPSVPDDPELDRLYREYEVAWANAVGCPMLGYSKTPEDDKRLEAVKKKIEEHANSEAHLWGITSSYVGAPATRENDKNQSSTPKVKRGVNDELE